MRLTPYFENVMKSAETPKEGPMMSLHAFAFGPVGMAPQGQWAEIYRLAYERTVEALRPTRYDFALRALSN